MVENILFRGTDGMTPGTYWSGYPAISGTIVSGQTINWSLNTKYAVTFVARPNGKFTQVTHADNYNGYTDVVIKKDGTISNVGRTASLTDVDYYISSHNRGDNTLNVAFTFT